MDIKMTKNWSANDVRMMCIREGFYTEGTNEDYTKMLEFVDEHSENPEDIHIYAVADSILMHTSKAKGQTLENIMYILANDVIKYFYEVEFSEAEKIIAKCEGYEL